MTKQRHCYVTQVGDAIEALASALDPERDAAMNITNPKLSDRLRPNVEAAPWVIAEIEKLEQQLAKFNDNREAAYRLHKEKCDQLRQRFTKINDIIYAVGAPLGSEAYFTIRQICCDNT